MGGSGSRLSKELLVEYQVRETPVPREFVRGPAFGRVGVSPSGGRAADAASGPGPHADPLSCFAFQDLTFLTKQEILL